MVAHLQRQPAAAATADGLVPAWFPVIDGTVHVRAEASGNSYEPSPEDGVTSTSALSTPAYRRYTFEQTSIVATSTTAAKVAATVRESIADTFPDHSSTSPDDGFDSASSSSRPDVDGSDSLQVDAAESDDVPGVVVVEVSATYATTDPLRLAPRITPDTATELNALATDAPSPLEGWSSTSGLPNEGAPLDLLTVDWTATAIGPDEAANEVVAGLGRPQGGDVEDTFAQLQYADGWINLNAPVDVDDATTLRWSTQTQGWGDDLTDPIPLAASEHGVPLVTVDVESSGPVDIVLAARPMADAIAEFEQAGMIAIDGAVPLAAQSGVDAFIGFERTTGDSHLHQASQLVVVDTPKSPAEIAAQLEQKLVDVGFDSFEPRDETFYVDGAGVGFDAASTSPGGLYPRYVVEVGASDDHPGLVAVWLDASLSLAGPLPEVPASTEDYFAPPRAVAAAESWEPTRWFVVEGEAIAGGAIFCGNSTGGPLPRVRTVSMLRSTR